MIKVRFNQEGSFFLGFSNGEVMTLDAKIVNALIKGNIDVTILNSDIEFNNPIKPLEIK